MLASGKVVWSNPCTEGSQTAKSGTDEQERHKRLCTVDKQAHHCNVLNTRLYLVDAAGIGGRNMLLPGDIPSEGGKSAEAIVIGGNEPLQRNGGLTEPMKG